MASENETEKQGRRERERQAEGNRSHGISVTTGSRENGRKQRQLTDQI